MAPARQATFHSVRSSARGPRVRIKESWCTGGKWPDRCSAVALDTGDTCALDLSAVVRTHMPHRMCPERCAFLARPMYRFGRLFQSDFCRMMLPARGLRENPRQREVPRLKREPPPPPALPVLSNVVLTVFSRSKDEHFHSQVSREHFQIWAAFSDPPPLFRCPTSL